MENIKERNEQNYEQELMVTITLDEYRELVATSARYSEQSSRYWRTEQRARDLEQERNLLEAEVKELKARIESLED